MSRAAHATHSHEYSGVIQLIVMSQAVSFNSTQLTLIMKRLGRLLRRGKDELYSFKVVVSGF